MVQKTLGGSNVATATVASQKSIPWVEKYRPKSIEEISSQGEVVAVLRAALSSTTAHSNLPHMLFYGPPGTGKTSTILAMARDLYGAQGWRQRVLELNASDERGIAVIRTKVKDFAKTTVSASGHGGNADFKLIVLDEADCLTVDAQSALRRTMEQYSKTTRFCIICNYVSRIIEPIASRCAKFRFRPVEESQGLHRLREICVAEGVKVKANGDLDEVLKAILDASEGDLRRAITLLQSAHNLTEKSSDVLLNKALIEELAGVVPLDLVKKAIQLITNASTRPLSIHQFASDEVVGKGFGAIQFIQQLSTHIMDECMEVANTRKALFASKLSWTDYCLSEGANEALQLSNLMLQSHLIFTSPTYAIKA